MTGADSDGASGAADEGDEGDGATSRAGTDDPASAADQS